MTTADDRLARVFLSYSRRDHAFVERLASALSASNCLPDYDLASPDVAGPDVGISAEEEWWLRLQDMIAAASVVVLVLSPHSAYSTVCSEEIAYARSLGKRVIPVLYQQIDFSKAPPRISSLNVKISFVAVDFSRAVQELLGAIRQDVNWLRSISRLTVAARRWRAAGEPPDLLIQGVDVREAQTLLGRRPATAPPPPELLLDYVEASSEMERERAAIRTVERARYEHLLEIVRPFVIEELRVRAEAPAVDHAWAKEDERLEKEMLQSLLTPRNRWHRRAAVWVQSTSAWDGYAEVFRFPCCGTHVQDFMSSGETDPPSQFRFDGCEAIPSALQHDVDAESNKFASRLVREYRRLTGRET